MDLFEMFNIKVDSTESIKDVRTEKQIGNKYSYDVGEKLEGAKKDLHVLKEMFIDSLDIEVLREIERVSAVDAYNVIEREAIVTFSLEEEKRKGVEPSAAKLKQLIIQRIDRKPLIDHPIARELFVLGCKKVQNRLATACTFKEVIEAINNLRTEIANGYTFCRKQLEMRISLKQALPKYLEIPNAVKEDNIALLSLGEKFVSLYSRNKTKATAMRVLQKQYSWDDLLQRRKSNKCHTSNLKKWNRKIPEHIKRVGDETNSKHIPEEIVDTFNLKGLQFGHYTTDQHAREHICHLYDALYDLANILGLDLENMGLNKRLGLAIGARGSGRALGHYERDTKVINLTRDNGIGVLAHEFAHAMDHYLYDLSHDFKNGKMLYLSETKKTGEHLPVEIIEASRNVVHTFTNGTVSRKIDVSAAKTQKIIHFGFIPHKYEMVNGNSEGGINRLGQFILNTEFPSVKLGTADKRTKGKFIKTLEAAACYHYQQTNEWILEFECDFKGSHFLENALEFDRGRSKPYFSTIRELFARAFEGYVENKLVNRGLRNDYLVTGTMYDSGLYPNGEEAKAIYSAIDQYVLTVAEFLNKRALRSNWLLEVGE
ncbi:LPD1 domain-containing protein [Bacillus mycoides]|uniref:LPD1 domain-containing protein n=1 Tax=Bacillus mycoides TaxID=1405 RepID=UPI0010BF5F8F|nr:LPD1 domain-containing protein [Bacillus mycoides]TKI39107.1 hypothetical protein FC700_21865 [Bacillus mycoides]